MSMKKFVIPFTFLLAIIICVAVPVGVTAQTSASNDEAVAVANFEDPTGAVEPATEAKVIPSDIKGLKVTEVESDSLLLSWNKSLNATLYTIYRAKEYDGGKIGEYEKYKTVKNNTFRDTGLSEAKIYKYQIFAYAMTDNYVTQSKPASASVMTKLKNVPSVQLYDKTTKSMTLSWEKSPSANNYIIYRADEKGNGSFTDYKKIREVKGDSAPKTTDTSLIGGTVYKYKVVAERTQGDTSAVSSGKTTKGMTKFSAPENVKKAGATETSIKLTWNPVTHADKYEIYRDWIKVKSVKTTEFNDKDLLSGSEHAYQVRAIRKVGKSVRRGNFAQIKAACKIPGNRIVVSIANQNLKVYKNNKVVFKTNVITGAPGDRATSTGHHHILSHKSPAILKGSYRGSKWTTKVSYWMGFTYSGQGIHDATWQGAFGGQLYRQGRGSHGCVNVSMASAKRIYELSYAGMLVIVK